MDAALKPKADSDGAAAANGAAAAAAKPAAPHSAPIYYKFDPAFVVNFGGEGSARYLQVTVEAMSRDRAGARDAEEQRAGGAQRPGACCSRARTTRR